MRLLDWLVGREPETNAPEMIHPETRAYYGRRISRDEIETTFEKFGSLPPREMRYCTHCGSDVRWVRETPGFSARSGVAGHSYHLQCVNAGRSHWHAWDGKLLYQYEPPVQGSNGTYPATVERVADDDPRLVGSWFDPGTGPIPGMRHSYCWHYDSRAYKWLEGDRESYGNDELP